MDTADCCKCDKNVHSAPNMHNLCQGVFEVILCADDVGSGRDAFKLLVVPLQLVHFSAHLIRNLHLVYVKSFTHMLCEGCTIIMQCIMT